MLFSGIFIFILFIQCSVQVSIIQLKMYSPTVIIIDHAGHSTSECCTGLDKKCNCSDLSLALQHMQSNTEIQIKSDISLYSVIKFNKTISNVNITGFNNAIIHCDGKGGLLGKNVYNFVIQGITLAKCKGITIINFTNIKIINCVFKHSVEFALMLNKSSVVVENSIFVHSDHDDGLSVYSSQDSINRCHLVTNGQNIDRRKTIADRKKFNISLEHAIYCYSSNLTLNSSTFTNNANLAKVFRNPQLNTTGNVTFHSNNTSASIVNSTKN